MVFGYSLAGLVVGVAVGATGVGGGSLMTPILILFYGVAPFFPGMGVGGIAGLYHLPGPAPVIPMGNVDFRGLAKLKVPLPMGGPVCLQLWLEGLYVNLGFPTFADPQPEPAWFF